MEVIERNVFKTDPVFNKLWKLILAKHKTADHTVKNLIENKEKPGFCEIAVHFAILPPNIFISYQIQTWLENERFLTRVEKINLYDNEAEYMVDRVKGMKDLSGFVEKN